jgi:class 3 adenylate cyclase
VEQVVGDMGLGMIYNHSVVRYRIRPLTVQIGARRLSAPRHPTARASSHLKQAGYSRRSSMRQSLRIHLIVYGAVNFFLILVWAAAGGGYFWPIWSILGWGIGVAAHAIVVFSSSAGRRTRTGTHPPPGPADPSVDAVARSVGRERPSLRPAAAPDGTVTMMFSDIEASTVLNERLGDTRWMELLRSHNALVREQIQAHGGFEVKSQGDGFMVAFPSARRAIQCAQAIQRAVDADLRETPGGPVKVRIGLHTGEAIREESDFYGKNVVLAARIADEARGGEVLVSSVVKQLTESSGDLRFDGERQVELDGLAGSHTVYRIA